MCLNVVTTHTIVFFQEGRPCRHCAATSARDHKPDKYDNIASRQGSVAVRFVVLCHLLLEIISRIFHRYPLLFQQRRGKFNTLQLLSSILRFALQSLKGREVSTATSSLHATNHRTARKPVLASLPLRLSCWHTWNIKKMKYAHLKGRVSTCWTCISAVSTKLFAVPIRCLADALRQIHLTTKYTVL